MLLPIIHDGIALTPHNGIRFKHRSWSVIHLYIAFFYPSIHSLSFVGLTVAAIKGNNPYAKAIFLICTSEFVLSWSVFLILVPDHLDAPTLGAQVAQNNDKE